MAEDVPARKFGRLARKILTGGYPVANDHSQPCCAHVSLHFTEEPPPVLADHRTELVQEIVQFAPLWSLSTLTGRNLGKSRK